jgi:hypothetical protein
MARAPARRLSALSGRRKLALIVAAALVVAAGLGAGLWFGLHGGGHVDRQAYLTRVSSVCRVYARRLSRIGAPSDVTAYGDVIATVGAVVPLLRRQGSAMEAVPAPDELKSRLRRLFALNRTSVTALESMVASARRRDAGGVAKGLVRFSGIRDRTHALSLAIGIDCSAS